MLDTCRKPTADERLGSGLVTTHLPRSSTNSPFDPPTLPCLQASTGRRSKASSRCRLAVRTSRSTEPTCDRRPSNRYNSPTSLPLSPNIPPITRCIHPAPLSHAPTCDRRPSNMQPLPFPLFHSLLPVHPARYPLTHPDGVHLSIQQAVTAHLLSPPVHARYAPSSHIRTPPPPPPPPPPTHTHTHTNSCTHSHTINHTHIRSPSRRRCSY